MRSAGILLSALALCVAGCTSSASGDPILWLLDRKSPENSADDLLLRMLDRQTPPTLDAVDYQRVALSEVLRDPEAYASKGVLLACRYHGPSNVYVPTYTLFTSLGYQNFSVWQSDAPIWEPDGFASDVPFFYVDRRQARLLKELGKLALFDQVELSVRVASVFGGRPYFQVDGIRRRRGPRVTLETLRDLRGALAGAREGRWQEGAASARRALQGKLPEGAEFALRKALGRCLLEQGDARGALAELREAAREDPADLEVLKWAGCAAHSLARSGQGPPSEAVGFLETAGTRLPDDPEVPLLLSEAYAAAGRMDDAAGAAQRAVTLAPRDPAARVNLGVLRTAQDQLAPAAEAFHAALDLDPEAWQAWLGLAKVQVRQADMPAAAASFRKALGGGGALVSVDDRFLAARSFQALGRFDEARQAIQAALETPGWQDAAAAQAALGEMAFAEGDFQAAASAYEAGLALEPRDPDLLAYLGAARLKGGDAEGARKALESSLSGKPARPGAVREALARACVALGDLPSAAKAVARANEAEETAARRFLQGDIARLMGRSGEAEKAYARTIALDPQDLEAHLWRGILLGDLGRYEEAGRVLEDGLQLDPENPAFMTTRAYFLLKEGQDLAGGLALAEKAFARIPDNPEAAHAYGWALLLNGKPAEALPVLQTAATEDVPEFRLHLAQAWIQHDRPEEARALLDALAEGEDALAREARALLKELLPKPVPEPAPEPGPASSPVPAP